MTDPEFLIVGLITLATAFLILVYQKPKSDIK